MGKTNISMDKRYAAALVAFVSGAILLAADFSSTSKWDLIRLVVEGMIGIDHYAVSALFSLVIFIAGLGGLAVILGGSLIAARIGRFGRLLIGLGTGMGVLGIILAFVFWRLGGPSPLNLNFGLIVVAVALSMYARSLSKKKRVQGKD